MAITGDLLQDGDVAWVPYGGPWAAGALERTIASIERIAALDPVMTIPGHGPPVTDVPAAVAATLERYARFREDPSRAVWHAVRRALVSHLMIAPRDAAALAALAVGAGGRRAVGSRRSSWSSARWPAWPSAASWCATATCTTPPSRTSREPRVAAGIATRSRDSCGAHAHGDVVESVNVSVRL